MMKNASRTAHAAAAAHHASRVSSKHVPHTTHKPTESFHNVFGYNPDPKKGELAVYGRKYFKDLKDMPRPSFFDEVVEKVNDEFGNPVQMGSSYMAAHDGATKVLHNKKVHDSFGTPVCRTKYSQFGPSVAGREPMNMSNPPNYVYSTPADASSYLRSPPPPTDLFVRGTRIYPTPDTNMDLAPGAPGTHPAGVVRSLDADFDMLPAPLPPIAPAAPMSDVRSPPYTFPRANRNSMNRMNCNKNTGSP
jgi:hypothetical protein